MLKKIVNAVLIIFLLPFPFIGAADIMKKFSPYFDGNSIGLFIGISLACGLVSAAIGYYLANRSLPKPLLWAGAFLFVTGISMSSVMGLGAAPDFSPAMLQHPEREQYRYALLFLNALLFGAAFLLVIRNRWQQLSVHKWIVLLFIPAFAEMIWEFQHHFFLGSRMQQWINGGKDAAAFMVNYTPEPVFRLSGLARCLQYASFAWFALLLMQGGFIKKWACITIAVFCAVGFCTGVAIALLGYASFAKLGILLLFVIPAGPFAMQYWIGLALLSKKENK